MTRYSPLWLQQANYAASVDRRLPGALWPLPASSGCQVTQTGAGMQVAVGPGTVAVPTQNNTGTTLAASDASETVTIAASPPSGTNRIDLIICRPRGNDLDGGTNNDFIFDVVAGTAAATPTPPAVPAGTVALAQVYVGGGVASITNANITDLRPGGLAVPRGDRVLARAYRNAAWTVAAGVPVPYDAVTVDTHNGWTLGANASYRVPVAGDYLIVATHGVSASTAADFSTQNVTINAASPPAITGATFQVPANISVRATVNDVLSLNAGDVIQPIMWPNGLRAGLTGPGLTYCSIRRLL